LLHRATLFIFPEHHVLRLLLAKTIQLVIDSRKLSQSSSVRGLSFEFHDLVCDCVLIFHTISIKNLEGTFKLKASPAIGFLVLECLLLRGKGLAHLDVSHCDCPFLILHTIIMKYFEGSGNRKRPPLSRRPGLPKLYS
jgi:hypothetical protein